MSFQSFIDSIKSGSDREIANKFKIEYLERRDQDWWRPLEYACRYGRVGLVKILIENKCDINASDYLGYQPIHLACWNGHIDIVKILIANKCDINASDKLYGYQPIHLACENGHIDIVKILIVNKCDINASNWLGSQPIHVACQNGHIDIVKILIDNNCDSRALTKKGESLIDIAKQKGYQEIIDIIAPTDPIKSIVTAMNLKCLTNCNHKLCPERKKPYHNLRPQAVLFKIGTEKK